MSYSVIDGLVITTNVIILTTKIVLNVGHALFPKTDFMRHSKNVNRFGTQMPNASIAMTRSRSNLDYNHAIKC